MEGNKERIWIIEARGINSNYYYVIKCRRWGLTYANEVMVKVEDIITIEDHFDDPMIDVKKIKTDIAYIPVNNITIIYSEPHESNE